jgi:D-alanyl-lipoteichoic acid acyltransferase DltB (MBOAT superfamily)
MSRFFRDYVYIPLGGNRCRKVREILNLGITALLSGLWHGAAWTFVFWGGMHGLFIISSHIGSKRIYGRNRGGARYVRIFFGWLTTQMLICVAWIVFRSSDLGTARSYFIGLLGSSGHKEIGLTSAVVLCFLSFFIDHTYGLLAEHKTEWIGRPRPICHGFVYALMVIFLYNAIPDRATPFIYFQF